ncbi:hypothetical protein AAA294_03395 [Fusobacterium varium]|uniref:hypothetical protein n=1 Tax=Fusobacterium varium TaxID=856 RepID=UPI0032C027B4
MDNILKYYDISLSKEEKDNIYSEYKDRKKDIEREFCLKTSLNMRDIRFLFFALALQITRQFLLTGKLGESFDKNDRLPHDDKKIKEEVKKEQVQYKKKNEEKKVNKSKKGYRTWLEIAMTQKVPYDAMRNSTEQKLGLNGSNHRVLTLGHDPILGWIFGTLNIITDTMTLTNFQSYKINLKGLIIEESIPTFHIFKDGFESIMEDQYRLPAAIFAQGIHLKSDQFTKMGLPVPILGIFSEEVAGELYKKNYDSLCAFRDVKTIGSQAILSIFVNTIIGLVHGLYYDGKNEEERKLYEIKTRKILLYSNIIASTSDIIYNYVTQNIKSLDIGGLGVTIFRIVSDINFINSIKREFLNTKLSEQYQEEIEKLDIEIEKILKELNFSE